MQKEAASGKLTQKVIVFILINSILGSSLFYLPSLGVISAGPGSLVAWAILFVVALVILFYYAELIAQYPTSGGTYLFCKKAYGRFWSFMLGWLMWIVGNMGMGLSVVAAAEYLLPATGQATFILRGVFTLLWILILNYIAFRGMNASTKMLVGFGIVSLGFVAVIVVPTFIDFPTLLSTGTFQSHFNSQLFSPFFREVGWFPILGQLGVALFLILEAFFGFDILAYMGDEVKDKQRMPQAMMMALLISGVIMLLFVLSSLGVVGYDEYTTNSRPYVAHALATLGSWSEPLINLFMLVAILGAAAGWPIVGSRLIQAMAEDGLFIKRFAELHPRTKTPYKAIWWQTIMVTLFSAVIFYGYVANWVNPYKIVYVVYVLMSLIVLAFILWTIPLLRKKDPQKRLFTAPFPRAGPAVITLFLIILVANWISKEGTVAIGTLRLSTTFIILGIPLYFLIEMYYNKEAIQKMTDSLSSASVATERLYFPKGIEEKFFSILGELKGKHVLEFGGYTGLFTSRLATHVTPKGKVHSVGFTKGMTAVVSKRVQQHRHVTVVHHPETDDVRLKVTPVDVLVSTGALSSMHRPEVIFKKLAGSLKKGGKVVLLDFEKYFYVIPNLPWFKNDQHLIELLRKAGFQVKIERKRGLMGTYIFIHGVKK